jgi:sec-independent protein translocase protein TatA
LWDLHPLFCSLHWQYQGINSVFLSSLRSALSPAFKETADRRLVAKTGPSPEDLLSVTGYRNQGEITMFEGLFQPMHLLALLIIAMFVFGPKRLPELGKAMGEGIRSFKNGIKDSSVNQDPPLS